MSELLASQELGSLKVLHSFALLTSFIPYETNSGDPRLTCIFQKCILKYAPKVTKGKTDSGGSFLRLSTWTSLMSSSFYCSSIFGHWGTRLCSEQESRYVPLAEEADTPLCVCVVCGWARACLAHSFQ